MKDYLFDTNVLLLLLRGHAKWHELDKTYHFAKTRNFISAVSLGELYSLALRNKWNPNRLIEIGRLRQEFIVLEIDEDDILQRYGELDAYSQRKIALADYPMPTTPRNMGKNDLWIAATGAVFGLTLFTADKDFEHLNGIYLDVILI
jgi:tRNA(fMet)-specific endonuclease VapC